MKHLISNVCFHHCTLVIVSYREVNVNIAVEKQTQEDVCLYKDVLEKQTKCAGL